MKNKIFSNRALFNFLGRFPHLRFRPGRFLCKQFYELLIPFRVTVGVMVVVEEEEERELWEGDKRGGRSGIAGAKTTFSLSFILV